MEERQTEPEGVPERTLIQRVDIRNTAMVVLSSVAALYFISWAQAVLVPLVGAILISYALDPLVSGLEKFRIPRPLGAALVLTILVVTIAGASIPLKRETMAILDKAPWAIEQFQRAEARSAPEEEGVMEKAQDVAKKIEDTAEEDEKETEQPDVMRVRIVGEKFNVWKYLMEGSSTILVLVSQVFSALLLVFFMLSAGRLYKRKAVRLSGPSFHRMRKTARIMNEFHSQVRRFLFVMLLGGLFVGFFTWLAFFLLGMEQAVFWGVVAGVASVAPYLGPFLVMVGSGVAAFIQFSTVDMALLIAAISLVITSIQGNLLLPMLTSRLSSLNEVAIFLGLLFWGWLWGPVGLIVATPVLMIIKTLCDHVSNLRAVGELLGK
ncbi:AI-2E family transporter [Marinobacter panjinensis]|uniref:AI-2E family transporter n=1 Tax=Marinobacter panjinensis TaxID=2576384 RepID=A0A4U6R1J2_9GAMM|nr:AI-2E family transporter [Marinobacter panjinensis]MCR8915787.1 AI-2E family transporter [Marinobacter panjinensis]TKV67233.1 AI-2E family transporter [Marinobacter panjinensis]